MLATLFGDGGDPCERAQAVVVSLGQGPRSLSEHRGGYDSPNSWQGAEDLDVAVLGLRGILIFGGLEVIEQRLDARGAALALGMDQAQAWQEQGDVFGGGLDYAGRNRERGSAQRGDDLFCAQAANAVFAEQPPDSLRSQAPPDAGRRRESEQSPQPSFVGRRAKGQGLRVETVQEFPQAVGQLIALAHKIFIDPREFPQLDHQWVVQTRAAKTRLIGAQRVAEHEGVAPVVFGAGHGVAVAKAIELPGVDGVDVKATLNQGLDYGAARDLDGDGDLFRMAFLRKNCRAGLKRAKLRPI